MVAMGRRRFGTTGSDGDVCLKLLRDTVPYLPLCSLDIFAQLGKSALRD